MATFGQVLLVKIVKETGLRHCNDDDDDDDDDDGHDQGNQKEYLNQHNGMAYECLQHRVVMPTILKPPCCLSNYFADVNFAVGTAGRR